MVWSHWRNILVCFSQTTLCLRKKPPSQGSHYISLYNSVKSEPVLMIFGTQNSEDIWHWFLYTCPPHVKNVTTLPCKMQNFFAWSKLYDFLLKWDNFDKTDDCYVVYKLEFQITSVIQPVMSVMRCWCGYLFGARCRLFPYGPADATASQNLISCLI